MFHQLATTALRLFSDERSPYWFTQPRLKKNPHSRRILNQEESTGGLPFNTKLHGRTQGSGPQWEAQLSPSS